MDVEDALELLSSQFTNRAVRQYAVSRLKEANDDVSAYNKIIILLMNCALKPGHHGLMMVSALDSESSGPGSSPGRGHCVVFLSKNL